MYNSEIKRSSSHPSEDNNINNNNSNALSVSISMFLKFNIFKMSNPVLPDVLLSFTSSTLEGWFAGVALELDAFAWRLL